MDCRWHPANQIRHTYPVYTSIHWELVLMTNLFFICSAFKKSWAPVNLIDFILNRRCKIWQITEKKKRECIANLTFYLEGFLWKLLWKNQFYCRRSSGGSDDICILGTADESGAHLSPFAALSFPDSKKVPFSAGLTGEAQLWSHDPPATFLHHTRVALTTRLQRLSAG